MGRIFADNLSSISNDLLFLSVISLYILNISFHPFFEIMYQFINYKNMKCLDNWKLSGLIAVKFNIKSIKYHLSYPLCFCCIYVYFIKTTFSMYFYFLQIRFT